MTVGEVKTQPLKGKILGKKTKNPAKHIKQLHPSIEYESKQHH